MTVIHVLITGAPGVGKTSLVKKVCDILRQDGLSVRGFYTEEVREHRNRIGFDVVTLDGKRCPLARVGSSVGALSGQHHRSPQVGKYSVDINSFEGASLPTLQLPISPKTVVVIDEIGKMEMFSRPFQEAVSSIFGNPNCIIMATIPVAKGNPIPLVKELVSRSDTHVFTVSRENRDTIIEDIVSILKNSLEIK